MAYIVISNLKISEAVIEAEEGGFCLVKLPDTGARFRVRKSRIHAKREEATEHLRTPERPSPLPSAVAAQHPMTMSREGPDGRKKGHLAEKDPSDDGRGFAKKLKEKWEMADNSIDIERLRRDMADECMAAFFGGGIGPALLDSLDIEEASDEKLLAIARQYGYDLNRYKR